MADTNKKKQHLLDQLRSFLRPFDLALLEKDANCKLLKLAVEY